MGHEEMSEGSWKTKELIMLREKHVVVVIFISC